MKPNADKVRACVRANMSSIKVSGSARKSSGKSMQVGGQTKRKLHKNCVEFQVRLARPKIPSRD